LEVDVDDAEALGEAQAPLQVVEERPGEVAADVDAQGDGPADGLDVLAEVVDAERIVDLAADRRRRVVEGGAVLGDVEGRRTVAGAETEQDVGQRPPADL